jgi:hypothetical protein
MPREETAIFISSLMPSSEQSEGTLAKSVVACQLCDGLTFTFHLPLITTYRHITFQHLAQPNTHSSMINRVQTIKSLCSARFVL